MFKMLTYLFFMRKCGEITITLTDETEKMLRNYVTAKYPEKPYGKLSLVVEDAIKQYLENH